MWKNERFTLTWKIFRENSHQRKVLNALISRKFSANRVIRVNCRNFHPVHFKNAGPSVGSYSSRRDSIFEQIWWPDHKSKHFTFQANDELHHHHSIGDVTNAGIFNGYVLRFYLHSWSFSRKIHKLATFHSYFLFFRSKLGRKAKAIWSLEIPTIFGQSVFCPSNCRFWEIRR